jgi:hypothetical protein
MTKLDRLLARVKKIDFEKRAYSGSGCYGADSVECVKTFRIDYAIPTRKLGCWMGEETKASKERRHEQREQHE